MGKHTSLSSLVRSFIIVFGFTRNPHAFRKQRWKASLHPLGKDKKFVNTDVEIQKQKWFLNFQRKIQWPLTHPETKRERYLQRWQDGGRRMRHCSNGLFEAPRPRAEAERWPDICPAVYWPLGCFNLAGQFFRRGHRLDNSMSTQTRSTYQNYSATPRVMWDFVFLLRFY